MWSWFLKRRCLLSGCTQTRCAGAVFGRKSRSVDLPRASALSALRFTSTRTVRSDKLQQSITSVCVIMCQLCSFSERLRTHIYHHGGGLKDFSGLNTNEHLCCSQEFIWVVLWATVQLSTFSTRNFYYQKRVSDDVDLPLIGCASMYPVVASESPDENAGRSSSAHFSQIPVFCSVFQTIDNETET